MRVGDLKKYLRGSLEKYVMRFVPRFYHRSPTQRPFDDLGMRRARSVLGGRGRIMIKYLDERLFTRVAMDSFLPRSSS